MEWRPDLDTIGRFRAACVKCNEEGMEEWRIGVFARRAEICATILAYDRKMVYPGYVDGEPNRLTVQECLGRVYSCVAGLHRLEGLNLNQEIWIAYYWLKHLRKLTYTGEVVEMKWMAA